MFTTVRMKMKENCGDTTVIRKAKRPSVLDSGWTILAITFALLIFFLCIVFR